MMQIASSTMNVFSASSNSDHLLGYANNCGQDAPISPPITPPVNPSNSTNSTTNGTNGN